ncbi:NHLP family bacteriocin export ABC transporter peptidase/permease/ATPase subunit [Leptolyngbya sp. FACHB-17]|uniref:NHLP family bacteriocin export ABC transporter peptidase/permease/ATPase subunit n=1 Tax=unclassified Leptolyngbya TaxID=2650499 RepID=UPI00168029BF|nr:NHLP family bacteriocin export ABC transporter peptidase/permease/ATPase subunit [Leptolyngbya sp. FACHB-17]
MKTPTVLQMEAVECGAAALGIILAYYGRIVPLAELRRECSVSRDGSKASNVLKAARNYGMSAKGFKKSIEAVRELTPPYIVFWNFNHFLVVEGIQEQRVYLNDPATGPRTVSLQEFDESFTGVALVIRPTDEFKRGGRKPSLMLALVDRLSSSTGALLYCVIAGFFLVLPRLAIPVFSQVFVDNVLIEGRYEWLRPLILGMLITGLLQALLTLLQLRYLRKLRVKLSVKLSSEFLWHILRLPVSFYAQRFAGEISNRVRLNDNVSDVLSGRLASTVIEVVMLIFYLGVMIQYDLVLTSIGVFFAIVNVSALQWISRRRIDTNMRLVQEHGKVAGASIAGLQSMETLKASGLESEFFSRWAGYYAKAINAQQELDTVGQVLEALPSLLSSLTTMLLLVVGGFRVMDGNLSIGMLIAFQSLMGSFQGPVNSLVSFGSSLQELEGSLNRLDDVLQNETDPQVEPRQQPVVFQTPKLQGHVELKNITYGYSRASDALIENFNLSVKPGQRVALVGGSGSGKSTIAKLITGLYEPWSGEVLFDGKPRSQIPRSVLTHSVAMVEQEIFLFAGTVRDNLTLWDATVPDSYLIHACRDAAIHDTVLSIPGGYDALLLEGAVNLSGGQRQRLELARSLVYNPSVLVMDEATSALDTETEKIIDQNLRRRGCTCVIVAHRLSTIRDCDEIIVLERGRVVQRGTHEQLRDRDGVYARLIKTEGEALQGE